MHTDLAVNIHAILLSLNLRDEEKLQRTNTLLYYSDKVECLRCMPDVFSFIETYDAQVAELCIKVIMQMFYRHEATVVSFFTVDHVYNVFRSDTNDMLGGELIWRVLRWKATLPNYPFEESEKILKLLLRRTRQGNPKQIPCSALRWWLVLMWRDFPRMRPKNSRGEERLPSPCVPWLIHWIASSRELLKFKVPLLQVLMEEIHKAGTSSIDGRAEITAWIMRELVEALPMSVGCGDLQLVFHFVDMETVEDVLHDVLGPLDSSRLVTIFALLLAWTPVPVPTVVTQAAAKPTEMYLSILVMWMRVYRRRNDPALTETCLRLVAAVGCEDENAFFSIILLSLLKPEFADHPVWEFSMSSFLDTCFLRFGEKSSLFYAFNRLGFHAPHPKLLREGARRKAPDSEPKIFVLDEATSCSSSVQSLQHSGTSETPGSPTVPPLQDLATQSFVPSAEPQGVPYVAPAYVINVMHDGNVWQQPGAVSSTAPVPVPAAPIPQSPALPPGPPPPPPPPVVPPKHEILPFSAPDKLPKGVRNCGNSCYLGTVCQGLAHTDAFVSQIFAFSLAIKTNPSPVEQEDFKVGEEMLKKFKHFFGTLLASPKPHVGVDDLVTKLPVEVYIPNEQADPGLTLRFLFDKFGSHDQSLIRHVFTGEIKEHLQCQVCKTDKEKRECFSDLVVNVPMEDSAEAQRGGLTIQELLDKRFEFEVMTGDDQMFCDRCQSKRDAGKWSELVSPPQHIALSLGRLHFDKTTFDLKKEMTFVDISPTIMMAGFLYKLYFCIYHKGNSAHSGDYHFLRLTRVLCVSWIRKKVVAPTQ
eukprot:GEMP01008172.1.p1 GENE.GEMP01008172.1~~GEMP01008172.1.p1  ORF type:complete len:811 (+),score=177.70 GEMP01008172.1:95-2527(+)